MSEIENEVVEEATDEVVEEAAAEEVVNHEEEESTEETEEDPKPKPKKTAADRVQEIRQKTWEMREAERRSIDAARRAEEAAKKLEEAQTKTINQPAIDDFETDEEYQKANQAFLYQKIEMEAEKRANERIRTQTQRQRTQEVLKKWDYAKMKETENNPDFQNNELKVAQAFRYFNAPHLEETIVESDMGVQITNHLAKNLDEAERIAQLSPMSALKEIGKLEYKLSQKPRKRTTKAPEPVIPETGGTGAPKNLKSMDFDEFCRLRNKQETGR